MNTTRREFLAGMMASPTLFLLQKHESFIEVERPELLVDYATTKHDEQGRLLRLGVIQADNLNRKIIKTVGDSHNAVTERPIFPFVFDESMLIARAYRLPGNRLLVISYVLDVEKMTMARGDDGYLFTYQTLYKWRVKLFDKKGTVIDEITDESPPNVVRIQGTSDAWVSSGCRSLMQNIQPSGSLCRNQNRADIEVVFAGKGG